MSHLRIVHVSDLHLFVQPDGARRPQAELTRIARWALQHPKAPLVGGFNVHEAKSLAALRRVITQLAEAGPIVLVQSGDVSTFGYRDRGTRVDFPEWEFWRSERNAQRRRQPLQWIDLYGNHDVWPGTLPIMAPHNVERARDELRRQHHPEQLPRRYEVRVGGGLVELYTLNTVQHDAIANTFARGRIDFDHPDRTAPRTYPGGETDPLAYAAELAYKNRPPAGTQVLRILIMHHPPHFFGRSPHPVAAWWEELTSGSLENAPDLFAWLRDSESGQTPFHVVLAGHRHEIDPATPPPMALIGCQQATQMVCSTATQIRSAGDPAHSFSVYDVDMSKRLTLSRTLYERPGNARDFAPSGSPTTMMTL